MTTKLSDRLRESANDLFEQHFKSKYVSELLMKGKCNGDPIAVASHVYKDGKDWLGYCLEVCKIAAKRSETQEEKAFFESCVSGFESLWNNWVNKFNETLGPFDKEYFSQPISQTIWSYKQHLLKEATLGTFLEALVSFLPSVLVIHEVQDYVKNNPNYKPNKFYDVLGLEGPGLGESVSELKNMIDQRDENLSEVQVKHLCELYKRSVVYEIMVCNSAMRRQKWFE